MEYRALGNTGLKVSRISLGTVELGLDYGIKKLKKPNLPSKKEAIRIVKYAFDNGINLFDTAPAYGRSEELLGEAFGPADGCYIATKVSVPFLKDKAPTAKTLTQKINSSIDSSLHALHRDAIDILQIHNATVEVMRRGEITDILSGLKKDGKIRFLGVSVYGEETALFAIKSGRFDIIQVAYNILDQRMRPDIFPAARRAGIGIINRSALFKGVLTSRARGLSGELAKLLWASRNVTESLGITWDALSRMAIRFCLSCKPVHTVLVGANNIGEVKNAVCALLEGPLNKSRMQVLKGLNLDDVNLLNESYAMIQ